MDEIKNQNDSNEILPECLPSSKLTSEILKSLTGWATFKAVIEIITGALSCLSFFLIFPAVFGVLQIIAGTNLLKATDEIKRYASSGDEKRISEVFFNFNKYFRLSGISIIIQIAFVIVLIILYIVLIVYFMSNMPNIMDKLPNMRGF
ncbi:hypothetical protein C4588_03245 [Candidatus Parcubacteria bacterium]|nr:MAG: hypothetical protein C4588_03245 [Candidatus Parcubacteria bacterium]